MRKADTAVVAISALVLLALLFVSWLRPACSSSIQTTVLILTAAVVLWYTLETARIRRDAEARSKRERMPQVDFSLAPPNDRPVTLPQNLDPDQLGSVAAATPLRVRFILLNHSPNPALARVRLRLQFGNRIGVLHGPDAYSGDSSWQIAPFFKINGVFDLCDLVRDALQGCNLTRWPERSLLVAQVDIYSPEGLLLSSVAKEYTAWLDRNAREIVLWPEVQATIESVHPVERIPG